MERDSTLNLKYLTFGNPTETCGHLSPQGLEEICTSGKSPTTYNPDSVFFADSFLTCQPLNIGTSHNSCLSPENLHNTGTSQSQAVLNF